MVISDAVPKSFYFGDTIDWEAPWSSVIVSVELPFWLMIENSSVKIELEEHVFTVFVVDTAFEYHTGSVADSKNSVSFFDLRGDRPLVPSDDTAEPTLRRKCKTILGITSRCNSDVWEKLSSSVRRERNTSDIYLKTLCSGHIPVINKLIQTYRVLTYDLFVHEVSAWDVPSWHVTNNAHTARVNLSRYREWDRKPVVFPLKGKPAPYSLIDSETLLSGFSNPYAPAEAELLDALNLYQRGDVSGAIRRMVTAIEVIVEARLQAEMLISEGDKSTRNFIEDTRTKFNKRISKIAKIRGERFAFWRQLNDIRDVRHDIVHKGRRIAPSEFGLYSKNLDEGRWIYNWVENNPEKKKIREGRQALRNLGGSQIINVFQSVINSDGILVRMHPSAKSFKA